MKNKIIFLATLTLSHIPSQAIQNSTANACAALVVLGSVGGSIKVWYDDPNLIHPAILGGASLIATGLTYHYAHKITPAGRLKRARAFLAEVARHKLAHTMFAHDREFFDAVQDVYLTDDLPLIGAYNSLTDLLSTMHYAFGLINGAAAEIGKDVVLQEECDSALSHAHILFRNISDAIKRIREHKDYLPQLTIYKESLNSEKQTIAQEQMAFAQMQMASAQQSSTMLKWLKLLVGK